MKKKLLFSVGALSVISAFLLFSNKSSFSQNVSLESLVKINSVSAECITSHNLGDGKCLVLTQICVGDPYNPECDFGY